MWSTDKNGDWKNFDFVKKKMTHAEGLLYLESKDKKKPEKIHTTEELCKKLKNKGIKI
jgi:hypothetical protein